MTREKQVFDLDLFLELNEEYKDKPVVPRPRRTGKVDLEGAAKRRAANIDKSLNVRDERVLEIGCGRGAFSYVLARDYACDVVGVDIAEREWSDYKFVPNLDLRVLDVSSEDHEDIGQFDLIYSSAVWGTYQASLRSPSRGQATSKERWALLSKRKTFTEGHRHPIDIEKCSFPGRISCLRMMSSKHSTFILVGNRTDLRG